MAARLPAAVGNRATFPRSAIVGAVLAGPGDPAADQTIVTTAILRTGPAILPVLAVAILVTETAAIRNADGVVGRATTVAVFQDLFELPAAVHPIDHALLAVGVLQGQARSPIPVSAGGQEQRRADPANHRNRPNQLKSRLQDHGFTSE